jgi:ComF family protein
MCPAGTYIEQGCAKMFLRWRWVFPSRWLPVSPSFDFNVARRLLAEAFGIVFPEDCRVCSSPLRNLSRIPVCPDCLSQPQPFVTEYFCAACRTPFMNGAPLDENGMCSLCRLGLTEFEAAFSFGEYEGTLRKLIHLFKYQGIAPLGRVFGKLLSTALPRDVAPDVIVPMPLHWKRAWHRGFNQSDLLARALSGRTGLRVARVVRRRRATPAQAGLTRAERRVNVAGAFEIKKRHAIGGKHVLLVDDVMTTGATASACAGALKRAGARRVTVLTLARVDRRKGFAVMNAASA